MINDEDVKTLILMEDAVYEIFGMKDIQLYKERKFKNRIDIPDRLKAFCDCNNIRIEEFLNHDNSNPSVCCLWYFSLSPYTAGTEKTEYMTILSISKLAPVYYLDNPFTTTDRNPHTLCFRTLESEGSSEAPKTLLQRQLCNNINKWLSNAGYSFVKQRLLRTTIVGMLNIAGIEEEKNFRHKYTSEFFFVDYYRAFFMGNFDDYACLDYYYENRRLELAARDLITPLN